jgi:two-component system CheB/CheR fusion protein
MNAAYPERSIYLDSLLETVDDAIVGTDADFCITVWNPAAERLYGYEAEEVLGRHAREVATYEGDVSRDRLEAELTDSGRARTELTARCKDGALIGVEVVVSVVYDGNGEVLGYLGVHRDVTERRRREVESRTIRDEERHRLARDLHDNALQGLIRAMIIARSLPDDGPAEEEGDLVTLLMGVSQQLRAAIYDLRLGEDSQRPFAERLRRLVATHKGMAGAGRIELEITDPVPPINGDRATSALGIVGEALANATRHAGADRITVHVTEADGRMTVQVADDGIGFVVTELRFEEAAGGLVSIRERAGLLGADLRINSEPGHGTVIDLTLLRDAEMDPG